MSDAKMPERICIWDAQTDEAGHQHPRGWTTSYPAGHPAEFVRADLCASGQQVRALAFIEAARFIEEMEQVDPPEPMTTDMLKAVAGAGLREMAKRVAALPPAPEASCRKCGGPMRPGIATGQTVISGMPDDLGGDVQTMSVGGPGAVIPCSKCADCGWSVTAPAAPAPGIAEAAAVFLADLNAIDTLVKFQLRHTVGVSDKTRSMRYKQVVAALRALEAQS